MPLNIYKNSEFTLITTPANDVDQQQVPSESAPSSSSTSSSSSRSQNSEFFLTNYTRSITLLDMCLFDYEHLQYAYSELAASALYLSLCQTTRERRHRQSEDVAGSHHSSSGRTMMTTPPVCPFAAHLVEKCTGLRMDELDRCIKWMRPHADVCEEMLLAEAKSSSQMRKLPDEDPDNVHNIQTRCNYRLWLVSFNNKKVLLSV